jgi:uncharacterized protein (TIGR03032 family)
MGPPQDAERLWLRHDAQWRDPAEVATEWNGASEVDPQLLEHRATGEWWSLLERLGITLIVSREYEHLLLAMGAPQGRPQISYLPVPHPSGLVVDRTSWTLHVASTRNPNQVIDLLPARGLVAGELVAGELIGGADVSSERATDCPFVPIRSRFLPGCLYLHDLAVVGGGLHANAVGMNAVISISMDGRYEPAWWPRAIDTPSGPAFGANYLQLNSIAAGRTLEESFFSASSDHISSRRPGHRNYPVDRRGVIFSGSTREPIARGLTRPHSARLHEGRLWVDNSGYGELVEIEQGGALVAARLPGWTRGLALYQGVAFVGTSRVIPRFARYAPGLDVESSQNGVHAVDMETGQVLGSITWPWGNQVFAIDWVPAHVASGLPFRWPRRRERERTLFSTFQPRYGQSRDGGHSSG